MSSSSKGGFPVVGNLTIFDRISVKDSTKSLAEVGASDGVAGRMGRRAGPSHAPAADAATRSAWAWAKSAESLSRFSSARVALSADHDFAFRTALANKMTAKRIRTPPTAANP